MRFVLSALAVSLITAPAWSAPVLTLDPADGAISGTPGSTIGWGFSLASDATNWTLITAVQMNVGAVGVFEDYLSAWVSNNSFALAPGALPLIQAFSAGVPGVTATGLASVILNANAPLGPITGAMDISYELYDADPFQGGNFVSAGNFTPAFQITVSPAADIPEPGTAALVCGGLVAAWIQSRRHRADTSR
ncbi:MAG: PEP-CTERM sorting domain-containing protein [Bryobacterales bacterium]|nr:PEP-CTERM sorting domain-containing protein [Bryobacterales bacterium]